MIGAEYKVVGSGLLQNSPAVIVFVHSGRTGRYRRVSKSKESEADSRPTVMPGEAFTRHLRDIDIVTAEFKTHFGRKWEDGLRWLAYFFSGARKHHSKGGGVK